jgi:hypothetical protein
MKTLNQATKTTSYNTTAQSLYMSELCDILDPCKYVDLDTKYSVKHNDYQDSCMTEEYDYCKYVTLDERAMLVYQV